MKKSKLYIAALALLGLSATSCSDFLDREDTNGDYVSTGFFRSEQAMYDGLMGVYNSMYMDAITGFYMLPANTVFDHLTPMLLERNSDATIGAGGTLNPDNALVLYIWQQCYIGIARANEVIFGSQEYQSTFTPKAMQYLAEVHALRAYFYYLLTGIYGDVPFFTAPVSDNEYDTATRTSRETIFDFLIADLNNMAQYLPWKREESGRLNRGFAYGLINRIGLIGGGLDIAGKGKDYYKAAADAAKKVIDEGGYQLTADYGDLFTKPGQAKPETFDEIFYELPYTDTAKPQKGQCIGYGQTSRIQGQTGRHSSLMFADTYECIDGLRIDESPLYDNAHPSKNRDPRFAYNVRMEGDEMTVNIGTDITTQILSCYKPVTQVYSLNSGTWSEVPNQDFEGVVSASWASFCNAGAGTINAKYALDISQPIALQYTNVIFMRYAEILLGYAEAKIELGELDESVYSAINAVRNRAGMPDVADSRKGNQAKMRQLVRRERKVELMMEGLHLIDMHRWKTGALENMYPSYCQPLIEYQYEAGIPYTTAAGVSGVSLGLDKTDIPTFKPGEQDENDIPCYDAYKQKLKVRDVNRRWEPRFELWPIPSQELARTKNLVQNPGY
ncbi:MAG: RagB/SusD family nutrient uptake outer membrane protein [Muribaculaceae bacterium]|nr:RagB/SusD family nutrient uptake outer membrane protein [Muribaculaceae bacterium]